MTGGECGGEWEREDVRERGWERERVGERGWDRVTERESTSVQGHSTFHRRRYKRKPYCQRRRSAFG